MSMPGFTADAAARSRPAHGPLEPAPLRDGELVLAASQGELVPQFLLCTPCLGLPSGPFCFRILGRRFCLNIPNVGRWKGCCDIGFFSISNCGVRRC